MILNGIYQKTMFYNLPFVNPTKRDSFYLVTDLYDCVDCTPFYYDQLLTGLVVWCVI